MKTWLCICGNRLHFGNTACLRCGRALGFLPERRCLTPLEAAGDGRWHALAPSDRPLVRHCANRDAAACDWMVAAADDQSLCLSCRLTEVTPDLAAGANHWLWTRMEAAKRYLVCDIVRLGLPLSDARTDPAYGIAFRFLSDEYSDEGVRRIVTGHRDGRITINVAEADDVHREHLRVALGEAYRTLLGHMRHEIGHYYWFRLVADGRWLPGFREAFGDERQDYAAAMGAYYERGPAPDWSTRFISAYASAHPWEDWAESWAHYLHITDALESAREFRLGPPAEDVPGTLAGMLDAWDRLSVGLNAMSRSLGLNDPYPFVITAAARRKLEFIHDLVEEAAAAGPPDSQVNGGSSVKSRLSPSPHASRMRRK